jgi:hypothetical protein
MQVTRQEVLTARNLFFACLGGSIAAVILIHGVSKSLDGAPGSVRYFASTAQSAGQQAGRLAQQGLTTLQQVAPPGLQPALHQSSAMLQKATTAQPPPPKGYALRPPLTLAYFAAMALGFWSLTQPRAHYLNKLYEWRFLDCPPTLKKSWQLYLHSLQRVIDPLALLALVFVLALGIWVMAQWYDALRPLATPLWAVRWLAGLGLIAYPFVAEQRFSAAYQRRYMLNEQLATLSYRPRDLSKDRDEEAEPSVPRAPVEATGPYRFRAGGFEWAWDDFYKNCIVFGATGTGKTLCVLNALVEGLIASGERAPHRPGGLILDPKGDFRGKIEKLCRRYGRAEDLLVLDPHQIDRTIRWNPLDSEDDELELASRFAAVLEMMGMKDKQNSFWVDSARKFIRHAIALIRATNPPEQPPSFAEVARLANSAEAIAERSDRAVSEDRGADRDSDIDLCLDFFGAEWMTLAEETRSSIQAYVTNMVDPFLMRPYSTVFSGRSTWSMGRIVDEGKILYVYMPIADKEAMSKMACTFVKLAYFREVLKRVDKPAPTFFLCDEFQSFFTTGQGKGDADFFERSRQSRHANIVATQNRPALLKTVERKDPVDNLLGNCLVKVFLRNGDMDTNDYASRLFGQQLVEFAGTTGGGGGGFGGRRGVSTSASATTQYDAKVRPEVFLELTVPSPAGADYCESIVQMAARSEVTRERLRWKVHPLT